MGGDVIDALKVIYGEPVAHPQPRLIMRARDLGWLAVSPKGCSLKIGVTGQTEQEARETFAASYARTRQILAGEA